MVTTKKRISIQVANRDRHTELALLIQSLRTQTYQAWDLVILDESETPLNNCHFLTNLINRIKLENHCVNVIRNELRLGVCHARQKLIDEDYFDNDYICRLDDDVIIQPDYLERMIKTINAGYDIASGVTPLLGNPEFKRKIERIGKIINQKIIDKKGNIIHHGDDCGYAYLESKIIPADEFRSNALMKKEVAKQIKYPDNLTPVGFREEAFFSIKAKMAGFKIGVDTGAIAYHLVTPTGGCRFPDYSEKVKVDDNYFKKWIKELYEKGKLDGVLEIKDAS